MAHEWQRVFVKSTDWTWDNDLEEYEIHVFEEYTPDGPVGWNDLEMGSELVLRADAEAAIATERETVARYLRGIARERAANGDWPAYDEWLEVCDDIAEGRHHDTRHEGHASSENEPDSASADSCERKGGTESPDTSG